MKKAFTMIELIFVVVIIGILAGVAIPRFASTRNDAQISSTKATIASVKAALSTERQLRVLRGDFTAITSLNAGGGAFSTFSADRAGVSRSVLETTIPTCGVGETGCWQNGTTYLMPGSGTAVAFVLAGGQFNCSTSDTNCAKLTQ